MLSPTSTPTDNPLSFVPVGIDYLALGLRADAEANFTECTIGQKPQKKALAVPFRFLRTKGSLVRIDTAVLLVSDFFDERTCCRLAAQLYVQNGQNIQQENLYSADDWHAALDQQIAEVLGHLNVASEGTVRIKPADMPENIKGSCRMDCLSDTGHVAPLRTWELSSRLRVLTR